MEAAPLQTIVEGREGVSGALKCTRTARAAILAYPVLTRNAGKECNFPSDRRGKFSTNSECPLAPTRAGWGK
jgi:hypothetical protein